MYEDVQKVGIAVPQYVAEAYEARCAELIAWFDAHPIGEVLSFPPAQLPSGLHPAYPGQEIGSRCPGQSFPA